MSNSNVLLDSASTLGHLYVPHKVADLRYENTAVGL